MVGVGTLLLLVGLVGSFAATAGNLFFLILCDVAGLLLLLYGRHLYRGYSTDS